MILSLHGYTYHSTDPNANSAACAAPNHPVVLYRHLARLIAEAEAGL
jgi:hypothetical protein